jgi:hypothetical protein
MTDNRQVGDIPAVEPVATVDESSVPIYPNLLVESLVLHIHVEIVTGLKGLSVPTSSGLERHLHCIPGR